MKCLHPLCSNVPTKKRLISMKYCKGFVMHPIIVWQSLIVVVDLGSRLPSYGTRVRAQSEQLNRVEGTKQVRENSKNISMSFRNPRIDNEATPRRSLSPQSHKVLTLINAKKWWLEVEELSIFTCNSWVFGWVLTGSQPQRADDITGSCFREYGLPLCWFGLPHVAEG